MKSYVAFIVLLACIVSCQIRLTKAFMHSDISSTPTNRTALTFRPRDKRWILQEIFVSTVNYVKWNFVGRISVSLLDGLMRLIDPIVTFLIPRGAANFASILLSAIYKKLQFAIMYWFHSLFFYV